MLNSWKKLKNASIKNLFKDFNWEGLVAYNDNFEPIGKIRRSDFGYENNQFHKASYLFNE